MWKRKWKLEAEAPEAAIFYGSRSGSGSGKHEMNGSGSGSGSSKKILEAEAEAEAIKNSPLPHHCFLRTYQSSHMQRGSFLSNTQVTSGEGPSHSYALTIQVTRRESSSYTTLKLHLERVHLIHSPLKLHADWFFSFLCTRHSS